MSTTEYTLTSADVARLLGLTDETVRRYAEQGKLAHVRLPSGHRRFRRSDIDEYMHPVASSDEPKAAAS